MANRLTVKKQTQLNVQRVFNTLRRELAERKDSFKVIIKYSKETHLNLKKDENLQLACVQANVMLKEAANPDGFYFEDFGYDIKNLHGIDPINRVCFVIAQFMFSDNPLLDNCEIVIKMGTRIVQYEFKARLLSYIYTLACYHVKNPAKYSTFDWKWDKPNDLIYVYSYTRVSTEEKTPETPYSTKMVMFKIDNDVLDELVSAKLCDIPRDMLMGDFDYEKYFQYAKIYHDSICPDSKVRAVRTFYIILVNLKVDFPHHKGYLPPKIIEHIMSFVNLTIGVVTVK